MRELIIGSKMIMDMKIFKPDIESDLGQSQGPYSYEGGHSKHMSFM